MEPALDYIFPALSLSCKVLSTTLLYFGSKKEIIIKNITVTLCRITVINIEIIDTLYTKKLGLPNQNKANSLQQLIVQLSKICSSINL